MSSTFSRAFGTFLRSTFPDDDSWTLSIALGENAVAASSSWAFRLYSMIYSVLRGGEAIPRFTDCIGGIDGHVARSRSCICEAIAVVEGFDGAFGCGIETTLPPFMGDFSP